MPQLHDGIGTCAAVVRVGEADGLHRAETQRLVSALGHDLDGQAAIEVGRRRLPLLEARLLAGEQRRDEGFVFGFGERAVEVVGAGAGRARLVVAGLEPRDRDVDRLAMHDRSDGIEEGQIALTGELLDGAAQAGRGERAGGDDDAVPDIGRQARDLPALDGHERMLGETLRHLGGERVAVDRERAAGGQLVAVGSGQDERAGSGASPRAGGRWRSSPNRRSGTSWSIRARQDHRSCARRSCALRAFRGSRRGRPRSRSARRPPSPRAPLR